MQHYRRILSFSIMMGSVHALAISIDGAILTTGSTHGIQLWNIETWKEISITTHLESCGIISSAIWIKTKYALGETLCDGTALGYIMFVQSSPVEKQKYYQEICTQRLGAGLEVICFAWDPSSSESSHIAVGTCNHTVQVLLLSSGSQLQSVFALCFADHSLYVFGLYDSKVGSAAVYLKKGVFVINNATDRFTLYHLIPKQVTFREGLNVVIGGGSRPLAMLQHTCGALVQTIRKRAVVSVWAHQYDLQKVQPVDTECQQPTGSFFTYFAHIVIGLLCTLVGSHLHTMGELGAPGVNYTIVSKWWNIFPMSMSPLLHQDEMGSTAEDEKVTQQGTHNYEIDQKILQNLIEGVVDGRNYQPVPQEIGEMTHYAERNDLSEIIYL
ncbi:hypothetical protein EDD17DRAFT_1648541 [Pisolithus thermaeus]|nr:hypothetical protein EDD17DRAFT_1648541 [Pisolithus thermaeus]